MTIKSLGAVMAAHLGLLFAAASPSLRADTLIQTTGVSNAPTIGGSPDAIIAQPWTTSLNYQNVSISAEIGGTGSITAYLTNLIGPTATVANDVTSPVTVSSLALPHGLTLLFSGLSLPAGTYYLVLSGPTGTSPGWISGTTTTLGAGVTTTTEYCSNNLGTGCLADNPAFPPGSTFAHDTLNMDITVTGDSSAPEPFSWVLVSVGLAGLIWRRLSA
jgi:hypothetical protein